MGGNLSSEKMESGEEKVTKQDDGATGSDEEEGESGDQLSALVAARRGGGRGRGGGGVQQHVVHKSHGERALLLARSHIAEVVEGAGLAGEWLAKLEEADRLLRSAETAMASSRHGAAGGPQSSGAVESLLEDSAGIDALAFTKSPSSETRDNEVRGWIRQSFTESDAERLQAMTFKLQSLQGGAASSSSACGLPASVMDIPARLQSSPRLQELLERVGEFDADTVSIGRQPEVAGKPLTVLFCHILQKSNLCQQLPDGVCGSADLQTLQEKLFSFLKIVDESYLDVVYHNNSHAADVMLMMHWFFNSEYMECNMNRFDHLMGLVAAAIHDMGHNGMNNVFHVKTRSPMALRYNDRSVLENMHVAMAFELMTQNDACNWFDLLSSKFQPDPADQAVDLRQYMRKGLLSMVLMTDITKHDHLMHQIQGIASAAECAVDPSSKKSVAKLGDLDKKLTVLEVMLHAADVSNPARPEPIMLDWTRRIVSEFWLQGDEERRLGIEVSPLCDRQTGMQSVPQGQIGFVNFVVQPLFAHVAALIEEGKTATEGLQRTVEFWKRKKEEGATFEEIYPDTS